LSSETKLKTLKHILAGYGPVTLAYSGGVDSHFLMTVAAEVMGNSVLAVIALSELFAEEERSFALQQIKKTGIPYQILEISVFDTPEVTRNSANRCYECKLTLFRQIKALGKKEGFPTVIEGSNADDLNDYRPGLKALRELGIQSPLIQAGLTKGEIRRLSESMSLPTWDKPSLACLATRIPYNTPLTRRALQRVDQAESLIRAAGFRQVRVRDYGTLAKIELNPESINAFLLHNKKNDIVNKLKSLGYSSVSIDIEGYAAGKMNRELDK
jgi:uncharacterized protein